MRGSIGSSRLFEVPSDLQLPAASPFRIRTHGTAPTWGSCRSKQTRLPDRKRWRRALAAVSLISIQLPSAVAAP